MNTNINGVTFDINDGGDYCDLCGEHYMNCEVHTDDQPTKSLEDSTMNKPTNKTMTQLMNALDTHFENGCEADQMGDDHYAKRCAQAMTAIESMMDNYTNPKSLEDEPMNTIDNTAMIAALEAHTEPTQLEDTNQSQMVSIMAGELFKAGLEPSIALITACAWVATWEEAESMKRFMGFFQEAFINAKLTAGKFRSDEAIEQPTAELDFDKVVEALISTHYLEETDSPCLTHMIPLMGQRFQELLDDRVEAYTMPLASEGVTRRFDYAPIKTSPLFVEAIHAQEASESTVDTGMLDIARKVQSVRGQGNDPEAYVLKGVAKMDPEQAYVSEFKGDRRGRTYQASCFGYNGQASDRSRALMNLHGVSTDYNIESAKALTKAEMGDMVVNASPEVRVQMVKDAINDPVGFIIREEDAEANDDGTMLCKKPYSFVKAAKIMVELYKGNRPYIGMAYGLDAKCSGPQLGALITNSESLARSCGFASLDSQVADAYQRAIQLLEKRGIVGLNRNDIKKPFMGVFYGQSAGAFMDPTNLSSACWTAIHGTGAPTMDNAKQFHNAVTSSFGAKLRNFREAILGYKGKCEGKIKHFMPDGLQVGMNYKVKVDINGLMIEGKDDVIPDVVVEIGALFNHKMINATFNTSITDTDNFVRTGFVNMIQATDALIARLIIVHLARMGAQHIVAVHDCFRVNVHDMEILKDAIKAAYLDLFGSEDHESSITADMPKGGDIMGMYFDGANKALVEGAEGNYASQFGGEVTGGLRKLHKIDGISFKAHVMALGGESGSYYFAK